MTHPKQLNNELSERYRHYGLGALLPGLQHAIDNLEGLAREIRDQMAAYDAGAPARNKSSKRALAGSRGWPADPEARKKEMARRMAVHAAKVGKPKASTASIAQKNANHPRNLDHPRHQQWLARLRKSQAAAWARRKQEEAAA